MLTCVTQNDSATSSYCRLRGSTELDAWWRTEKAFAVGFPGPRHFFWIRGLDNNICRFFQKHRLSAQAPEHGSGEDIYLAGWLGTRMTRPHVICSFTIYDPVILNHKKKVIYGQDQDISFYAYCVHSHCGIPEARRPPALLLPQPGSGKTDSLILPAKTSVTSWAGFLQRL